MRDGEPGTVVNSPCVISLFSWQGLQAAGTFTPRTPEDAGARGGRVACWEVAELGCQPELTDQGLALGLAVGQPAHSGTSPQRVCTLSGGSWGALGGGPWEILARRKTRSDSDFLKVILVGDG